MNLSVQKRMAASILKAGKNRIIFDNSKLNEIKEAITKRDIRNLINSGVIKLDQKHGFSSFRINKLRAQKRKGKRKGLGSRKGKKTARLGRKKKWMIKVRVQRKFLKYLKQNKLISIHVYRKIYKMIKSDVFRSKRHLKLYLDENNLIRKNAI